MCSWKPGSHQNLRWNSCLAKQMTMYLFSRFVVFHLLLLFALEAEKNFSNLRKLFLQVSKLGLESFRQQNDNVGSWTVMASWLRCFRVTISISRTFFAGEGLDTMRLLEVLCCKTSHKLCSELASGQTRWEHLRGTNAEATWSRSTIASCVPW